MKLSSVSFLIPAYRDQDTIADVIASAHVVGVRIAREHEIVVVNDASPDNTGTVLDSLKKKYRMLRVITHSVNEGYGGAIRDLYYAGRMEWMFTVPGDNQIPVSEVEKLLPGTNDADMIIGWRVHRNDPPQRLRQSYIYNRILQMFYGLKLHDVNSVRLMKSSMMKKIRLSSPSAFVDAELSIRAERCGFRVIEIPINHTARGSEEGAGGGKVMTILPTILDMIRFRFMNHES